MGDDVKITVIATGFRDQMPERRARMLDVEDAPVVWVPVLAAAPAGGSEHLAATAGARSRRDRQRLRLATLPERG